MGNRRAKSVIGKYLFCALFLTLILGCSDDDNDVEVTGPVNYEIKADIRFAQSGYTIDLSYINDGNQDKIRFEDGNGNRITDDAIKRGERVVGIYLETFRTIPTSNITLIVTNLDTGELVANETVTSPISTTGNKFLYFYYSIRNDEVVSIFNEVSNFD